MESLFGLGPVIATPTASVAKQEVEAIPKEIASLPAYGEVARNDVAKQSPRTLAM